MSVVDDYHQGVHYVQTKYNWLYYFHEEYHKMFVTIQKLSFLCLKYGVACSDETDGKQTGRVDNKVLTMFWGFI